tara:strand:- start:8456 stop:8737 length:282 start_codon:yes stop_codon:yes gene_type:complete
MMGTFGAWTHLDRYYEAKRAYYAGTPIPEYADTSIDPKSGMARGDQAFDNFERGVRSMCRYHQVTEDLAHSPGYDEDNHKAIKDRVRELCRKQ